MSKKSIPSRLQPEAVSLRYTKFVWLKDTTKPALENNSQVERFTRVPLGMISSPFQLAATVKYHLNKPDAPGAKKIKNKCTLTTWLEVLLQKNKKTNSAMKRNPSSTNLREWASNFNEFLHSTPESDRANKDTIKVLGTIRKMNGDTIFINGTDLTWNLSCQVTSKREQCSLTAEFLIPEVSYRKH